MNGRYKEKLQKQFIKSTLIPLVIFFGIITLALSVYINGYAYYNLERWSEQTTSEMVEIYRHYEKYLRSSSAQKSMNDVLSGSVSHKKMTQEFRTYCFGSPVDAELLVLDDAGEAVYFSGDADLLQPHLQYFARLLYENQLRGNADRNTVYHYTPANMHLWLFLEPLKAEDGSLAGEALVLVESADLAEHFRNSSYETVIAEKSGVAVMSTNNDLLDSRNAFPVHAEEPQEVNGVEYLVRRSDVFEAGIQIYTLSAKQDWSGYYILGCGALLVMAALFLLQSRKFARQLAAGSAQSLEKLHGELAAVSENPQHKIEIDSDDEFGDIAQRINHMLAEIQTLNEKSLALERSRNDMEIAQIKSYFRPHFIYNTLESIHFSILMNDTEQAGAVLMKLTSLLRYSVDNTVSFFTLEEDMEHLKEYMDIMQFRHGDRFTWNFDIAEDTRQYLVPPLFIQPLVENSLKYGFVDRERIHINVRAWLENDALQLSISDNGIGMTPEQLEAQRQLVQEGRMEGGHFGIGLIARSVRLQYGEGSSISLDSRPGEGLTVHLHLKRRLDNGI